MWLSRVHSIALRHGQSDLVDDKGVNSPRQLSTLILFAKAALLGRCTIEKECIRASLVYIVSGGYTFN